MRLRAHLWSRRRVGRPKGPRLGTPPGGNGSGVTRSPREVPCAGSPGVFLPIYRQKHFGKPDTNGTHGTHAGTRRITQSVSHRRRRTDSHYTQPSTQPSRSRPTKNAHTHDRETSRPQTVPRSHCPEPTRPQRTRTSARERARRDAPEPTVETEPAEPTEPPRLGLYSDNARGAGSRPGGRPLVLTCRLRTRDRERDHPRTILRSAQRYRRYILVRTAYYIELHHTHVVELENLRVELEGAPPTAFPAWCF